MQSRIAEIHAADAEVLAVCVDPIAENNRLAEKLQLEFPILSDPELKVIDAFGVRHHQAMTASGSSDIARPAVFILDRKGVVRWRHLTNNWRVRVRPETILEQLDTIP